MHALALLLVLASPRAAETEEAGRVAVLPVDSRSTLPSSTRAHLRSSIQHGLARARVEIVSNSAVDARLGKSVCRTTTCARNVAAAVSSAWVLRSTVIVEDSVYVVQLDALDERGELITSADARCEICGYRAVSELIEDRSAALADKVELLRRKSPRLLVRSRPEGAEVWVDDRLVGHTPLRRNVDVGEHEIRVELRGHLAEQRQIRSVPGTSDTIDVTLVADHSDPPPRFPWLGVGAAALGTGPALIGAGVSLVVIDGREYERRCNPDVLGNCSHRYDTLPGGVALLVTGGVLLATGVALVVVGREARRSGRRDRRIGRGELGLALHF